jgi:hypothetical protein
MSEFLQIQKRDLQALKFQASILAEKMLNFLEQFGLENNEFPPPSDENSDRLI